MRRATAFAAAFPAHHMTPGAARGWIRRRAFARPVGICELRAISRRATARENARVGYSLRFFHTLSGGPTRRIRDRRSVSELQRSELQRAQRSEPLPQSLLGISTFPATRT